MSLDYSHDPSRNHKNLVVRKDYPYNAEPDPVNLVSSFVTPERFFFCRSHGSIPDLEEATHRISVDGIHATPHVFSVNELKTQFPKKSVMMAMQVERDYATAGHLDCLTDILSIYQCAASIL